VKKLTRLKWFSITHPHLYDGVIALFVALFIALFFSTSLSPIYLGENSSGMNMDSNLFRYCASIWLNGGVPYIDFFDHKGLYHLAIDLLGLWIGGRYGIWFLEIVFYWADLMILLPSVRLLFGDERRYRIAFYLLFTALQGCVLEGNLEGEWVLPFVSLFASAYVFGIVKQNPKAFFLGSFAMGLDVGLALNSRPVDGIYGALGALFFSIFCFRHHQYFALLKNALIAILGCAIPFVIFYSLAYAQGFKDLMVEAVFVQSSSYLFNSFFGITPLVWGYKLQALATAILLGLFFFFERKTAPKQSDLAFFFFFVGGAADLIFFVILGYGHYFQSGFGFLSLAFLYGLSHCPKIKAGALLRFVNAFLFLFLVGDLGFFSIAYYTPQGLDGYSYSETQEMAATISEMKKQGAGAKGSVFAIDVDCGFYIQGDFVVNERYMAFQKNWCRDNPAVAGEVLDYLSGGLEGKKQPKWVLVSKESGSIDRFASVIKEDYTLAASLSNSVVWVYTLNV